MSGLAIHAENLSKQYRLGRREPYTTLRESIVRSVRRVARLERSAEPETFWALKDVSFDIRHGDIVGVIGRNGAGKSTLLKLLARITAPTRGYADIYGRIGSLLEVGTGFHPELTGTENVYLSGAILGMGRDEIRRKFDEIVAFAEVERFLDTPVKHYSSGMYLRLAFAVAAHLEPEILVVDEVLAVGDLKFQTKCVDKMKDVSETGRTVIFVSHSMGAIHRLCSRCILLNEGQVVADGPTAAVIQRYVSDGTLARTEYTQPPDESKAAHLRYAGLKTAVGTVTSEFRYDQDVVISVEYEVNEPVRECSVWVGLYAADQTPVFGTCDTDADQRLSGLRQPGYYRTEVTLPGQWLNVGRYQLVVGIARFAARVTFDRVELATLTILDVGVPDPMRTGVLQPMLPWRTHAGRDVAERASAAV